MMARVPMVRIGVLLALVLALPGCEKPPAPEVRIERRKDFTPEEFGVGRRHTPNAACNREIDRLLDETRLCFNARPEAECSHLQEKHAGTIARLKGAARCHRSQS